MSERCHGDQYQIDSPSQSLNDVAEWQHASSLRLYHWRTRTAYRWRERYVERGVEGLRREASQPGRKKPLDAATIEGVAGFTRSSRQVRIGRRAGWHGLQALAPASGFLRAARSIQGASHGRI